MIELYYLIAFFIILVALFFGWHKKTQILIDEQVYTNKLLIELIKELRNEKKRDD